MGTIASEYSNYELKKKLVPLMGSLTEEQEAHVEEWLALEEVSGKEVGKEVVKYVAIGLLLAGLCIFLLRLFASH